MCFENLVLLLRCCCIAGLAGTRKMAECASNCTPVHHVAFARTLFRKTRGAGDTFMKWHVERNGTHFRGNYSLTLNAHNRRIPIVGATTAVHARHLHHGRELGQSQLLHSVTACRSTCGRCLASTNPNPTPCTREHAISISYLHHTPTNCSGPDSLATSKWS